MELEMHDTQKSHVEKESVLSASFERLGKKQEYVNKEIDFDSVLAEKEYFADEIKHDKLKVFIGEADESTELDSILTTLDRSSISTNPGVNPFKMCKNLEETEAEEILAILKKPHSTKSGTCHRDYSRSNPNLNTKKISLQGRVLHSVHNNQRNIPERVSNPFSKNFFDISGINKMDSLLNNDHQC